MILKDACLETLKQNVLIKATMTMKMYILQTLEFKHPKLRDLSAKV
jgi:hypothetical protein